MIFLLIGFAIIAFIDLPSLLKNKSRKDIVVYYCLFALAFIISFLQVLGIKIPSPAKGLTYLLKDVLHISYKS